MKTTTRVSKRLMSRAKELTGAPDNKSALEAALLRLIRRESVGHGANFNGAALNGAVPAAKTSPARAAAANLLNGGCREHPAQATALRKRHVACNPDAATAEIAVNIDAAMLARAKALTGLPDDRAMLETALLKLRARESARQLARRGGTEPQLRPIPRRRSEPA